MREPLYPVHDDYGREIGTVQRLALGRRGTTFWRAVAIDGADLGHYPDRDDACGAIRLDWSLGRPRHPRTGQRYRPVHAGTDAGIAPRYLGR